MTLKKGQTFEQLNWEKKEQQLTCLHGLSVSIKCNRWVAVELEIQFNVHTARVNTAATPTFSTVLLIKKKRLKLFWSNQIVITQFKVYFQCLYEHHLNLLHFQCRWAAWAGQLAQEQWRHTQADKECSTYLTTAKHTFCCLAQPLLVKVFALTNLAFIFALSLNYRIVVRELPTAHGKFLSFCSFSFSFLFT